MLILVFVNCDGDIQYFGEVNGRNSSLRTIRKYLASREYYEMKESGGKFMIYDRRRWLWRSIGYFYIMNTADEEFVILPELEFGRYGVLANVGE